MLTQLPNWQSKKNQTIFKPKLYCLKFEHPNSFYFYCSILLPSSKPIFFKDPLTPLYLLTIQILLSGILQFWSFWTKSFTKTNHSHHKSSHYLLCWTGWGGCPNTTIATKHDSSRYATKALKSFSSRIFSLSSYSC